MLSRKEKKKKKRKLRRKKRRRILAKKKNLSKKKSENNNNEIGDGDDDDDVEEVDLTKRKEYKDWIKRDMKIIEEFKKKEKEIELEEKKKKQNYAIRSYSSHSFTQTILPCYNIRYEFQFVNKAVVNHLVKKIKNTSNYCLYYLRFGCCSFSFNCKRIHLYPENSCTILIPHFFSSLYEDQLVNYSDQIPTFLTKSMSIKEERQLYEEFFNDIDTELSKYGTIVKLIVCRNIEPSLKGNVYIQYKTFESAINALNGINGRYFDGHQIIADFCPVTKWNIALCPDYTNNYNCTKGDNCKYIHWYRNPGYKYELNYQVYYPISLNFPTSDNNNDNSYKDIQNDVNTNNNNKVNK